MPNLDKTVTRTTIGKAEYGILYGKYLVVSTRWSLVYHLVNRSLLSADFGFVGLE